MLSWVAHEIKSPLAAALMAGQLAMRGIEHQEEPAVLKRRMVVIARQLARMDELVTSILEAARLLPKTFGCRRPRALRRQRQGQSSR